MPCTIYLIKQLGINALDVNTSKILFRLNRRGFEKNGWLTAPYAIRKIMGRFYRFRSMFAIGINVLTFPAIIFSLFNIKIG
jgi:hypothetical protein